jgi:hypothetical protein
VEEKFIMKLFDRIKKDADSTGSKSEAKREMEAEFQRKSRGLDFEAIQAEFPMPDPQDYNFYNLDPLTKRKITICNLFANHYKSIPEIIELLGCSRKLVVDSLVENQLIKDRRRLSRPKTPSTEELGKKRF